MTEKYTYSQLKKKIEKVDVLLQKFSVRGQQDNKEYRAYLRKKEDYQKQLESTKKYKEEKLISALSDVRAMAAPYRKDDNEEESSVPSSSSALFDESVNYQIILKKYDKVCRILQELLAEHSMAPPSPKTKKGKLYKKYIVKKGEYLGLLEQCEEWEEESYRRMEAQAKNDAKLLAQAEQERELAEQEKRVVAAREEAKAELERQKLEALSKVRAKAKQQSELEKQKEVAYQEAKRLEGIALQSDTERLARETRARGNDLEQSYKEQEARGMIRRIN